MPTASLSACAQLPTFSDVIDGLASGLGIARNKEDALARLSSYGGRIDAYSGSDLRAGLHDSLLELLAGSNGALRGLAQARLLNAETELTNARAIPLITEAPEGQGLWHFIEIWAAPWIAQMLADARQHPDSVLNSARQLLELHAAAAGGEATRFLATWKTALKQSIPEGVNVREFLLTVAKLDQRSQRKHSSIEQDLANLRVEMQSELLSQQALDAAVDAVRNVYIAGMATMRLCAMAATVIPENDLLALVFGNLRTCQEGQVDASEEVWKGRVRAYWGRLAVGPAMMGEYRRLAAEADLLDDGRFDKLRMASLAVDPGCLMVPFVDYEEGCWHIHHGRHDLAEQCLQRVVEEAGGRQLGEVSAHAASLLIALRLCASIPLKFEALNPLMRMRIDNMQQSTELLIDFTPTPFSDWSPRPNPSFYDSHLMRCVAFFNDIPRAPGVSGVCNPLRHFDASLESLIAQSRKAGAKLNDAKRKRPAIAGTSVKPYQVLRDHFYYRDALFGLNPSNLPGMDVYAMLPKPDQLRLLRFVDPEQFQLDLQEHGLEI